MFVSTDNKRSDAAAWRAPSDAVLVFTALAAVQTVLAMAHTLGRDELQAWLIARASHSVSELITNMRNEGHPPLWHGLLMLVQWATGSASPHVLTALQWTIALASSALIMFRAPFPLVVRALVVFNYFVLFEYGTLARAYSLGLLATLLYATNPRHRLAWIWIAVLPHASLHFAVLGGALGLWHLLTVDRRLVGPAVAVASAFLALWLMWPSADTVVTGPTPDAASRVLTSVVNLGSLAVPFSMYGGWNFFGASPAWIPINLLGAAVVLFAAWRLFNHRPEALATGGLLLAGILTLSGVVFLSYARHFGVLVLFAIVVAWRDWDAPRFGRRAFTGVAMWLATAGVIIGAASLAVPFSPYRTATHWMKSQALDAEPWAAYPPHVQIEPAAWLGNPIYDLVRGCRAEFPRWSYRHLPDPSEPAFASLLAAAVAAHGGNLQLALENGPLQRLPGHTSKLLAEFPGGAYSGALQLYQIKSNATGKGAVLPPLCPP